MAELTDPSLCIPVPFDPYTVAYTGEVFRTLSVPEGVGHQAQDISNSVYGTIHSEPAVSRFHEFGRHARSSSWASWGGNVYVANGGRVVWLGRDTAKFAGVLPPTTRPKFEIVRRPVYRANTFAIGTPLLNDPLPTSSPSQTILYHYDGAGNTYLTHPYHSDTNWDTVQDWFAFKCYVKPYRISGRHLLYSTKNDVQSGGIFVDILDGKCRVGWYDALSKSEVIAAETNVPVFAAGEWHYVNIRKRLAFGGGDIWNDSQYNGSLINTARDMMIVRQFLRAAPAAPYTDLPLWYAKATTSVGTKMGRTIVSFTTDDQLGSESGTNATGLVSRLNENYSSVAGLDDRIDAIVTDAFCEDMIGMIWQWGDGASTPTQFRGKSYRIIAVENQSGQGYTRIQVVDFADGAVPSGATGFHTQGPIVAENGGVFTGVKLLRTVTNPLQQQPDQSIALLSLFGSALALEADSGIERADLEFASFALQFMNQDPNLGEPNIFEDGDAAGTGPTEAVAIGCDQFGGLLYTAAPPGELHADATFTWVSADTQTYAGEDATSSIPSSSLEIVKSAESNASASNFLFNYLEGLALTQGVRKLRVRFYDQDQAAPGNPGPEVQVTHAGEDQTNPSGWWGILIKNLPISVERGSIRREVFLTESGGATLFLVAEVPDNASSSILIEQYEFRIGDGIALEVDNNAPPRCRHVEEVGGVLAFGHLERAVRSDGGLPVDIPDGVVFSKSFLPVQVPYTNFFQVASGFDEPVNGMLAHNGWLIVAKRTSTYRTLLEQLAPKLEDVHKGAGVLASDSMEVVDGIAYWLGDKGIYAYPGAGIAILISDRLEDLFTQKQIAAGHLERASATVNRLKNQYVVTFRRTGDVWTQDRLSTEYDEDLGAQLPGEKLLAGHRFSRYDGVNVVALGTENDPLGGPKRMLGGTDDGFVLFMDRDDTNRQLIGPTAAVWGATALVAGAGSTTTSVVVGSGAIDDVLAGPRSAVLRWGTVTVRVLLGESGVLHLDRPIPSASIPANLQALTLGVITHRWRTKDLDMQVPEARKNFRYLDVFHRIEGSGAVAVTALQDGGIGEDFVAIPSVSIGTLDLRSMWTRLVLNHIRARFVSIEFSSTDPFEILQMIFRVSDQDTRP